MPQHPSQAPVSAAQARHIRIRRLGGLLCVCFAAAAVPAWIGLAVLADRLGWTVSALSACLVWPWTL